MNRAEQAALSAYPYETGVKGLICEQSRGIFIKGYEHAEKDLALTWEDIRRIVLIYERVLADKEWNKKPIKDGYEEVLRRFNETRK